MPGPPRTEVLNAQPREAGKGPGQPPAKNGHCEMRPPGAGHGRERRRGAGSCRGDARDEQATGSAGGDSRGELAKGRRGRERFLQPGVGRRGLPSWLHPRVPAHEPDPLNSRDLPDIAAVSAGRCILLQASGATGFVLPNSPP